MESTGVKMSAIMVGQKLKILKLQWLKRPEIVLHKTNFRAENN